MNQLQPYETKDDLPLVASARTGLAGKDEALYRRVPTDYVQKSIRDLIDFLASDDLSDNEFALAESVRRELNAHGSVVVVNGKQAGLDGLVADFIAVRVHKLPDNSERKYRELEIEISAVQQGGYLY